MKRALLIATAAVACSCGQGGRKVPFYAPAGQYSVSTTDSSLTYTTEDTVFTPERTIKLRIRAPNGASGALPAVVVIHGGAFNNNGFNTLSDWGDQLARAGYVAIHFSNSDDELGAHCKSLMISASECTAAMLTTEVSEGGTIPSWLWTRPNDASAIFDRLSEIEAAAGVQIDRTRVGVVGHSGGSHATLSLAGLAIDFSPTIKNQQWLPDARFKAFVANSPQGIDHTGVTATSWDLIRAPVLIQTGRRDSTEGEPPAGRRHAFQGLDGPDAFEHYIDDEDTSHVVFALDAHDGVEGNELAVARTGIAFLDAYLLGRQEAKDWLAGDGLSKSTGGTSTLSRK
jgi:dienelactone hydrolase